jgi:hypothetical protein
LMKINLNRYNMKLLDNLLVINITAVFIWLVITLFICLWNLDLSIFSWYWMKITNSPIFYWRAFIITEIAWAILFAFSEN